MDQTSVHLKRAVHGDRDSVGWLVAHFHPLVMAQVRLRVGDRVRPEDVEDLANDVWVVALDRLADLEARDGRYAPVLVKFLGTTVLQSCNNYLRRRARRSARDGQRPPGDPAAQLAEVAIRTRGVVTVAAGREASRLIASCLENLDGDKREVLVLRVMEQRSNQEIAEILKIPPNTVAVRYRRALEALRSSLPKSLLDEFRAALA